MPFDPDTIKKLSVEVFRRFGIALCYRLECDRKDKRLARALKRLEQSLGPPANDKLRRDALNAASSIYRELYARGEVMRATACTLVCACADGPNVNLIGNFESALEAGEGLGQAEARQIEDELLRGVMND